MNRPTKTHCEITGIGKREMEKYLVTILHIKRMKVYLLGIFLEEMGGRGRLLPFPFRKTMLMAYRENLSNLDTLGTEEVS